MAHHRPAHSSTSKVDEDVLSLSEANRQKITRIAELERLMNLRLEETGRIVATHVYVIALLKAGGANA